LDEWPGILIALLATFAMTLLIAMVPWFVVTEWTMDNAAQDAARALSQTGSQTDMIAELQADLTAENLPTTLDGHNLFTVQAASGQSVGYQDNQADPAAEQSQVTLHYNAPLPFARVLTLLGGPALPWTVPMTITASQYNETQYTGQGGAP